MSLKQANALSLFSGIGGFEVGMARCGFLFKRTLEWDEKCCQTLNDNKAILAADEDEIHPMDITKVEPAEFYAGNVDYIVGGPPCQSFSAAGRRAGGVAGTNDERGILFEYYCKYVKHFKPKAFVFENVRGILSANKGNDFKKIVAAFQSVGYTLFWKVLNAADYGAPQLRERVFLVGIRNDLGIAFRFPLPTFGPDSIEHKNYITTGEMIADLQNPEEIVPPYGGKYGHLLPEIPPGENYRYYTEEMGHPNPLFAWRSKFSNFLYKMDPNDVCRTIIAYQGRYDGPFHWKNRKCTVDELKLLQGFPKDFLINQKYGEGVKQVGNSVCPLVAEQIAKALRYQIEGIEEFKVPLIEEGQTLTFDKRKGVKAKQSRAKKIVTYSDLCEINLFETLDNTQVYPQVEKSRILENSIVAHWNFKDGFLNIDMLNGDSKRLRLKIELIFLGSVTNVFKKLTIKVYSENWDDNYLKLAWDEAHFAVLDFSSYDSLLPLYGHFTEPYPKFKILFETDVNSKIMDFQHMALKYMGNRKAIPYEDYSECLIDENLFRNMREFGFDVRTNNTNRAIPEGFFRICYPFTMPNNQKRNVIWKE